jgi:Dyp-type peroxidase family
MAVQTLIAESEGAQLALDDIQADILIGLQKDAETFLFFVIDDVASFQAALALATSLGLVTSARTGKDREDQIALLKAAGNRVRLPMPGMNIGFTHRGIGTLLGDAHYADGMAIDASFVAGAKTQASVLGDDSTLWPQVFQEESIDGVMLITGESETEVQNHTSAILSLFGTAITQPVLTMTGATRPGQRGHEKFGFLDGVSQPGIRGLTASQNPNDRANQGLPGQDLIWPGEFVFGYQGQQSATPGDDVSKDDPAPMEPPAFPWMLNGSFMVWRRLEQDVVGFHTAVKAEATRLGMDATLLAARMVGRWPSGAPVVLAPLQDDPMLAASPLHNNNFEYARDDPDQRRCPYAAHIRKTYPRDDLNAIFGGESGEASVQTRRIRRAGIPFGPEPDDENPNNLPAGLMFVCYQTSIAEQFEFVQKDWANAPGFVPGKVHPPPTGGSVVPGLDPIIGQGGPRDMDEPFPNYPSGGRRETLSALPHFVTTTAAAYFFMPSLSVLAAGFRVSP